MSLQKINMNIAVVTHLEYFRSNPDILRSTLEASAITSGGRGWSETLQLHADPGSQVHTPMGSTEHLDDI